MSIARPLTKAIAGPVATAITSPGVGGWAGTLTEQVIARLNLLGGWAWDVSAASVGTNYQESARTNLVTSATQRIGSVTDITGKGLHATASGTARPTWDGTRCAHADTQFLATAAVNCTGTDTLTVISMITKANDTSIWTDSELGGSNAGSEPGVRLLGPPYSSGAGYGFQSKGSGSAATINNAPSFPAPSTNVVMGIGRVSTDTCTLAVNNVQTNAATTDQGNGNFQNEPFYFGAASDGTYPYFSGKWGRKIITPYEPSEDDKLLFQRWVAEPAGISIPLTYIFAAIGDSYTENTSVTANQRWPQLVDAAQAKIVFTSNLGASGNTTANMMNRRWQLLRASIPNIASIYGGQNDVATTVSASPTPTSTVFTVANASGFAADGWVLVGGVQAQVLSVVGSVVTLTAPLAGGAPAGGAVCAHDTEKNLYELAMYLKNAGCKRVLIIGKHYSNITSGGDTVSVEHPANAAMRIKQRAAALASGAVYVDVYAQGCALINGGFVVQGSASWHVGSLDDHLNVSGNADLVAPAVNAAIVAAGWA